MKPGCLVLETGEIFNGLILGKEESVGEAVFNTSHSGYEEIATDPSYYNQILVMTAPLQGNYHVDSTVQQSSKFHIKGFVCLEMQESGRDKAFLEELLKRKIPVLKDVDTRKLTLRLREKGSVWSAIVPKEKVGEALERINKEKKGDKDWTKFVSVKKEEDHQGEKKDGVKLALIDFGYKKSILKEMLKISKEVRIFPSTSSLKQITDFNPDAIFLSNGPGDPQDVKEGLSLVKEILTLNKPIFGICMGHQILSLALGAKTGKLKFGHRGSNHPIKDELLNKIYMSAQNHGYVVLKDSLPEDVKVSHLNLNDKTVAGIHSEKKKCISVQFHPECSPGPEESRKLFSFFINKYVGQG